MTIPNIVPNELVRGALEAALIVAIADPTKAPKPLHRFLKFQKMPATAMPVVRKVLDGDDAFRTHVAESVNLDALDQPSVLFLTRPEGWESELEELAAQSARAAADTDEAKAERSAQKKLKAAEQARSKAEARVQELTAELDRVRATLEQERVARRQAETTAHSLTWDIDNLRVRVRELEEASTRWNDERAALQRAVADSPGASSGASFAPSAETASEPFDASGIVAALGGARGALSALERALESIEDQLPAEEPVSPSSRPSVERRSRKEKHVRRSPSPLPGGVHDTSDEAARHLVSLKHVVLLVDGYNVSMRGWPDLPVLADQRARLLDRLAGLHATRRTEVVVVFDGTASGEVGASKAQPAHVVFTSAGVTADEEILRRIQHIPRERPVVVASSDREVTEGARRNGANSISADQLLAVI